MIERHGAGAAHRAAERVNEMIDTADTAGRDFWAQVVREIHVLTGRSQVPFDRA